MDFRILYRQSFCFIFAIMLSASVIAQEPDSTGTALNFSGQISVTNNGFSLVPTFTLGDPAIVSTFYLGGKGRFSFEPQLRYSLDFKPWSLIFIWRYQLIRQEKFEVKLGTHLPALSFRTIEATHDDKAKSIIQSRRFFPVMELLPTWRISDKCRLGMYYLYGRGVESDLNKNTHFIALQAALVKLPLAGPWHLGASTQFYLLKMDDRKGYYLAPTLTLGRKAVPFTISTQMNKVIHTEIAGNDLEWNISLNWAFSNSFQSI